MVYINMKNVIQISLLALIVIVIYMLVTVPIIPLNMQKYKRITVSGIRLKNSANDEIHEKYDHSGFNNLEFIPYLYRNQKYIDRESAAVNFIAAHRKRHKKYIGSNLKYIKHRKRYQKHIQRLPHLQAYRKRYQKYFQDSSTDLKYTKTHHRRGKTFAMGSSGLKYILQWTPSNEYPFKAVKGRRGFTEPKCRYSNCIFTSDRQYLEDITKFDIITFSELNPRSLKQNLLPRKRSPHQNYAFVSRESSYLHPVCSNKFDNVFNFTWTFRLDSEVYWGYIRIRDNNSKVIGPRKEMHWIKFKDMDPVSEGFKTQLKLKTKAAAWFVSKCTTWSEREQFVKELQKELGRYNLTVDVYGKCGRLKCARGNESCLELIKKNYHFYLSFEESFNEDYVTETLLTAVKSYAVPIVYGGANYSRFLPDHSHLNARELGAIDLAAKMYQLIKNPVDYYEYFRWKKYYSYSDFSKDLKCKICALINNQKFVKKKQMYQNFRDWWDPPNFCTNPNNKIKYNNKNESNNRNIKQIKVINSRIPKTKRKFEHIKNLKYIGLENYY